MFTLEGVKSKIKLSTYVVGVIVVILFAIQFIVSLLTRGGIQVTSQPSGTVFLNGTREGTTPQTVGSLIPAKYLVKVSADGYISETREVTVGPRETATLSLTLTKAPVPLTVESNRTTDLAFTNMGLLVYSLATSQSGRELKSFDPKTGQHKSLGDVSKVSINEIAWSQDGRAAVVDRDGTVWILANGVLTKLPIKGYGVGWSPDGSKLAYGSDRYISFTDPEGVNIYEFSTEKVTNFLKDTSTTPWHITWAPNGQVLLISRFTDEGVSDPMTIDLTGKQQAVSLKSLSSDEIEWAEDSLNLFISSSGSIYRQNLSSGDQTPVFVSGGQAPALSVSGSRLVVGDRVTGSLSILEGQEIRTIVEKGDPIKEVAAHDTRVAVAAGNTLVLFSF